MPLMALARDGDHGGLDPRNAAYEHPDFHSREAAHYSM